MIRLALCRRRWARSMTPISSDALTVQAVGSPEPVSSVGQPNLVDARVIKMVNKETVRLMLLGVSVSVPTSQPLKAGAVIKVAIESAGDLRLVVRHQDIDLSTAKAPSSVPLASAEAVTSRALENVRGAITAAVTSLQLDDSPAAPRAGTPVAAGTEASVTPTPATKLAIDELLGRLQDASSAHDAAFAPSSNQRAASAEINLQSNSLGPDDPSQSPASAAATPHQTLVGTFAFAHLDLREALQLKVIREDQQQRGATGQQDASHAWLVEFSIDHPSLGPVQTSIRQSTAGIGVSLKAENTYAVSTLKSALPVLSEDLAHAALKVDAVSVSAATANCPANQIHA